MFPLLNAPPQKLKLRDKNINRGALAIKALPSKGDKGDEGVMI